MSGISLSKAFVKLISGSACFLFLALFVVNTAVFSSLETSSGPTTFNTQNHVNELLKEKMLIKDSTCQWPHDMYLKFYDISSAQDQPKHFVSKEIPSSKTNIHQLSQIGHLHQDCRKKIARYPVKFNYDL